MDAMTKPTNEAIAQAIGLTHSGVSRIRSGQRLPLLGTMSRIAKSFDWPVEKQVRAKIDGKYVEEFEKHAEQALAQHAS